MRKNPHKTEDAFMTLEDMMLMAEHEKNKNLQREIVIDKSIAGVMTHSANYVGDEGCR